MLRSGSSRVSYNLKGETTQAFTRIYRRPTRRSRFSMSSYARPRDKSMKRRLMQKSIRLGARVVHPVEPLAQV